MNRLDKVWGDKITPKAIWHIVKAAAANAGIPNLAPHELRRTCARLCHLAGGELEQIQFLLGHASVQTTERYLGCKQKLRHAVNDAIEWRTLDRRTQEDFGTALCRISDMGLYDRLYRRHWRGSSLLLRRMPISRVRCEGR